MATYRLQPTPHRAVRARDHRHRVLLVQPDQHQRRRDPGGAVRMTHAEAGPPALWRVSVAGQTRLARGPGAGGPADLLPHTSLDELLAPGGRTLVEVLAAPAGDPVPADASVLSPVGSQEVWAAGVTYARSRDARMEESEDPDHYDRVYDAERPELFLKAAPGRA